MENIRQLARKETKIKDSELTEINVKKLALNRTNWHYLTLTNAY